MLIVAGLLLLGTCVLWLPALSDVASIARIAAGTFSGPFSAPCGGTESRDGRTLREPRLLFLIPAHNEELLVGRAVMSVQSLEASAEQVQVIVLADNCTDATADEARKHGAYCLERRQPDDLGKAAALAWAVPQLDASTFDTLVIVDADSLVEPSFARALARIPGLRERGVQAFNGVANPAATPLTRMAAVLSQAYYSFAYPLKQKAGLNVPLTGAGMCLGSDLLAREGWEARSLAEDVEIYVLLTLAGATTTGCPDARVFSVEAERMRNSVIQRRRWRRGRLQVAKAHAIDILRSGAISPHQKLDLLAELVAPGPATHLAMAMLIGGLAMAVAPPAAAWIAAAALASLLRPAIYTSLAVASLPDRIATARAFLVLPIYALWRFGLELSSFVHKGNWRRSER